MNFVLIMLQIKFLQVLLLFLTVPVWCNAKTVRYSLNPQIERSLEVDDKQRLTTKTYELQVPGSNPIRIIEAEPQWYQQQYMQPEPPTTTETYYTHLRDSIEHRAFKNTADAANRNKNYSKLAEQFTTQQTRTTINEPITNKCYGISCGNEAESSTESKNQFSPYALNKFLDEFAKKVKHDTEDEIKMDKVNIITRSPTDLISDKKDEFSDDSETDKSKSNWNLVDMKGHNHPFDDRTGWVTLEAVPWSTSKVSKWESNSKPSRWPSSDTIRPSWNSKPEENYYQNDKTNFELTFDNPRPQKPTINGVTDDKPFYTNSYQQDWSSEIPTRPAWNKLVVSRPEGTWNRPSDNTWGYDSRRPGRPSSHKHHDDKDCADHGDIVTDGKPGNFPSSQSLSYIPYGEPYRRPTQVVYADLVQGGHPVTHPETGDGQWVLLSTTKGYQYPKHRQRSLELNPDVLTARRSVRLTVLPSLNGSAVNMTTSHGGLLQVDSSFETVDEARKTYIRKMKHNSTRRPHKAIKAQLRPAVPGTRSPDTTAVLAAVGAGMVPATMAMVMPLVLGRKRRSVNNGIGRHRVLLQNADLSVTQLPNYHLESTLQRSL